MAAPSVTFATATENLRDELQTNITSCHTTVATAPYIKPYQDKGQITVIPLEPEYVQLDPGGHTPTTRPFWVWYSWRILVHRTLTSQNFEYALLGNAGEKGLVEILEDIYQHLEGNFLSLAYLREAHNVWDKPAFYTATLYDEENNFELAAGSFIYKVKLKQVAVVQQQNTPPAFSNIQSFLNSPTSVTITWTTDKPATSWVKYNGQSTTETSVYTTTHSVTITGLTAGTTYNYKPWGKSEELWYGHSAEFYSFTTMTAGGDIAFSDIELSRNLQDKIVVGWATDVSTKGKVAWRIKDSDDAWAETSLEIAYAEGGHSRNTEMPTTVGVYYEYRLYGITSGAYEEWSALQYIRVDAEGEPQIYTE